MSYRAILTMLAEVRIAVDFPHDQKDAKIMACALAADADYLITGDADFKAAQKLDIICNNRYNVPKVFWGKFRLHSSNLRDVFPIKVY